MTRADIVAEARSLLGTPFHHGQALKGIGCDCVGVLVAVAAALGLPEAEAFRRDVRFMGYSPLPSPPILLRACSEYLEPIAVAAARLGDILQYTFAKEPMHFAIISREDPRYVIHSYQRVGRVVENGATATFWRILRAYRFRGIDG